MFRPQLRTALGQRFKDLGYKVGPLLVITVFGVLVLWERHTKQQFAEKAQADWRQSCGLHTPAQECERALEAHHDPCFLLSYRPADLSHSYLQKAQFKHSRYRTCLELTPDGWRERRRAERAANERRRRRL